MASNVVHESSFLRPAREINGPGICGLQHPFKVSALAGGTVTLNSDATLGCPMISPLDAWIEEVVQPAAQNRLGAKVVGIVSMGSYNCRPIDNQHGAQLSEHSFGNAIDVGGFKLEDGRTINVRKDWKGEDEQVSAFLHEVHAGACTYFTTVLGPGADVFHYDHIHLDLAMHGSTSRGMRRYCKPVPENLPLPPKKDDLPDPPPLDEDLDVAQARPLTPEPISRAAPALALSAPLLPPRPVYSPTQPAVAQPLSAPSARPAQPAVDTLRLAALPHGPAASAGQPLMLTPPPAPPMVSRAPIKAGSMRSDGVFVPEGNPKDWDVTSSIRHRKVRKRFDKIHRTT